VNDRPRVSHQGSTTNVLWVGRTTYNKVNDRPPFTPMTDPLSFICQATKPTSSRYQPKTLPRRRITKNAQQQTKPVFSNHFQTTPNTHVDTAPKHAALRVQRNPHSVNPNTILKLPKNHLKHTPQVPNTHNTYLKHPRVTHSNTQEPNTRTLKCQSIQILPPNSSQKMPASEMQTLKTTPKIPYKRCIDAYKLDVSKRTSCPNFPFSFQALMPKCRDVCN
jgi:hypothetical protein